MENLTRGEPFIFRALEILKGIERQYSDYELACIELAHIERQKGGNNMSNFNFNTINNATISLGNGEVVSVKKLSLQINNVMIEENVNLTAVIKNGVLIITTK